MKVLKFGGTSVGSAQRMQDVAKLIVGDRKIVVLSAMSGTTNSLVEICDYLYKKNPDGANEIINKLFLLYNKHVEELYHTDNYKQKAKELIKERFDYIRTVTKDLFTLFEEKVVLAQGELISTGMMNLYLNECGVKSVLIPALDFMRTDKNAEPDPLYIKEKLTKLLEEHADADLYITQGYICRNAYGEIDNLQRGGSDYSASLIGAAINAEEIQIWTDIDGMHNNDPRVVKGTSPVRHLHFEEAAELDPSEVVYLCTGCQGEPKAALSNISYGTGAVKPVKGDVVVFSSRVIPGNEQAIANIQNRFHLEIAMHYSVSGYIRLQMLKCWLFLFQSLLINFQYQPDISSRLNIFYQANTIQNHHQFLKLFPVMCSKPVCYLLGLTLFS